MWTKTRSRRILQTSARLATRSQTEPGRRSWMMMTAMKNILLPRWDSGMKLKNPLETFSEVKAGGAVDDVDAQLAQVHQDHVHTKFWWQGESSLIIKCQETIFISSSLSSKLPGKFTRHLFTFSCFRACGHIVDNYLQIITMVTSGGHPKAGCKKTPLFHVQESLPQQVGWFSKQI